MIYLFSALLALTSSSWASPWAGKLDLSMEVNPVIIRELNDGNWYVGYGAPHLFHLDYNGQEQFHAGPWHAWRGGHLDAAIGLSAGRNVTPDLALLLVALHLNETVKFLMYADAVVALDFYGGYRPVHAADVHSWAYGLGMVMQKKFDPSKVLDIGL